MTEITLNSWLIVLGAIAVWILSASFFALKLFNKK